MTQGGFRLPLGEQVRWYLLVGGSGFVADAVVYLLLAHGLGLPAIVARIAAFLPATVLTWWINRRVTFGRQGAAPGHWLPQYLHYLAVQGVGIVVNFAVFHAALTRWPEQDLAAFALGSAVALVFNFAGSRWLVFSGARGNGSPYVVAAFGTASLALGQDTNWDLLNYHLYAAHAFATGRIGTDLAPAGLQSFFNPTLDLPYYWMVLHLPAPAVAFLMGCLHGLAYPLLVAIGRRVLPDAPASTARWLAGAGCLGAVFLSELATTMGDNTTALLVLAAVLMCLRAIAHDTNRGAAWLVFVGGLLVGAATGLKLTNACYAVALAAALFVQPIEVRRRVALVALLTAGGVAGLLLTSGHWFWLLWQQFGNPLFPQFNNWFGSPLAAPVGVADPGWRPKGWVEALAFPFIIAWNPWRFGEIPMRQLLWAIAYVALAAAAVGAWVRRGSQPGTQSRGAARLLIAFLVAGYACWLAMFGIGRYTVAMEMLLPLAVWLLVPLAMPGRRAALLAGAAIGVAVLASVLPFRNWGHASYGQQSYTVPPLPVADPARATALLVTQPVAWIAVFQPRELVFASVLSNFPETDAYAQRVHAILRQRGGDVVAVLPAATDTALSSVDNFNEWARAQRFKSDGIACGLVTRFGRLAPRYRAFTPAPGPWCAFTGPPGQREQIAPKDAAIVAQWQQRLAAERALALDASSCVRQTAFIGRAGFPYQVCRVKPAAG